MTRTDLAWEKLKIWASEHHILKPDKFYVGTNLGPTAEFYYPENSMELLKDLFINFPVAAKPSSIIQIYPSPIKSEIDNLLEIIDLIDKNQPETILFEITTLEEDLNLELTLILEKSSDFHYDLRIIWRPLMAFFNSENLKESFFNIFNFILQIGEKLQKDKVFFNSEIGINPKHQPDSLLEL